MPGRVFPIEGTAGAKVQRIGGSTEGQDNWRAKITGYQGYLVLVMAVLTGALSQKKISARDPKGS